MKKMNNASRWLIAILSLVVILSVALSVALQFANPMDMSEDWAMFADVRNIESTTEILDFCHKNDIDYSIVDGRFKMEDYAVEFDINKSECVIRPNKDMKAFALISNGLYDGVETREIEGTERTFHVLKGIMYRYEVSHGHCLVYSEVPSAIAMLIAIVVAFILASYLTHCGRCRKCEYGCAE